ncbi:MAG: DNA-3-methyladenine glycosylase I [Hahellaceae bacterium]|nr:DNA-3-methyladenine glycosylase I [Hahellaceae bacterium]
MDKFNKILERAIHRKGGEAALNQWLIDPSSDSDLASTEDHRWLSMMTRCIFQAGFVWRVVDQKWPDFETVFFGFVPEKMVLISPDQWENIGQDTRIIRNMQKILSVPKNAQFVLDISQAHGRFGQWVADWPKHDLTGLFEQLKKKGDRLGGVTGMRLLRNMGKDTFVLSNDVLLCLKEAGLDIQRATSKREMQLIQQAFNQWHEESGLPYSHLSRICACSVGDNLPPH